MDLFINLGRIVTLRLTYFSWLSSSYTPLAKPSKSMTLYDRLACFSPFENIWLSWISRHVSLPFFASILNDILHSCCHHFGILLASKTTFVRYRFVDDLLTCFLMFFGTLKCSIWDPFGTRKVFKKSSFSHAYFLTWFLIPKGCTQPTSLQNCKNHQTQNRQKGALNRFPETKRRGRATEQSPHRWALKSLGTAWTA